MILALHARFVPDVNDFISITADLYRFIALPMFALAC
jgi:hypothetical protein